MSPRAYQIHIRKEALKFSSAHMTVFSDRSKEALHGHNYSTEVTIHLREINLNKLVSFTYFKELLGKLCAEWDSKVLIAHRCPFLEIRVDHSQEIEFLLCNKRYVLPRDEVVLLPIDNIAAESLADLFCQRFLEELNPELIGTTIIGLEVTIEETSGQGATVSWLPNHVR